MVSRINIHIEADTAAEARAALLELHGGPINASFTLHTPRTGKAQSAVESDAQVEAEVPVGVAAETPEPAPKTRRSRKAAEEKPAISTGENRVGPEDDQTTVEQDKADEKAEVQNTQATATTIDDVKAIVNEYVAKYGMPATQEDGPKIFAEALGTPPEGEDYWKFSILPTDNEKLARTVAIWKRAVTENPLKREAV